MPRRTYIKFFFAILLLLIPFNFTLAKGTYPKLANYYLSYVDEADFEDLSNWDLVIVPTETIFSSPGFFDYYRSVNLEGRILSYIYPAMINVSGLGDDVGLNRYLYNEVQKNDLWLRGENGGRLEFWPDVFAVNVYEDDWQEFNVNYINEKIELKDWDGILYDIIDADISHYNPNGKIDIDNDNDNFGENKEEVNQKWCEGIASLLSKTRQEIGDDKLILINGNSRKNFQPDINGRMFETFPTPWEGDGTWADVMSKYIEFLPEENKDPLFYVINSNTENKGNWDDYKKMRFGLTSTLMGDGYFSFDYGDESHAQLWWYDEYNEDLGTSRSRPYNLLNGKDHKIESGLWRRDFENGIAVVNSTDKKQTYYFEKEEFEKIKGTQDLKINTGAKVNWVDLESEDGIILLKINNEIKENSFSNGSFVRVFNDSGKQTMNGFFSYLDSFEGNSDILISDIDNNSNQEEILVNSDGIITVYQNGEIYSSFSPYNGKFTGEISFSVEDLNGDGTKEIITGAGAGGGPHVRVFTPEGRPLIGGFFAYDENFRGGVNVAVMDLNGDGTKEIITGAGAGGGPHVRVFSRDGESLTGGFFAYSDDFKGGVDVTVGNIDGRGDKEIITGPGKGSEPEVRVFSKDGKLMKKFMAYGMDLKSGIKVMSYDMNHDSRDEILVSTINFK